MCRSQSSHSMFDWNLRRTSAHSGQSPSAHTREADETRRHQPSCSKQVTRTKRVAIPAGAEGLPPPVGKKKRDNLPLTSWRGGSSATSWLLCKSECRTAGQKETLPSASQKLHLRQPVVACIAHCFAGGLPAGSRGTPQSLPGAKTRCGTRRSRGQRSPHRPGTKALGEVEDHARRRPAAGGAKSPPG